MADGVGDDFLFKAAEVIVSGVLQELSQVFAILDFEGIATE